MSDEAQTRRFGWLKYGGRPGDLRNAKQCGAKARTRGGAPCKAPAMANGRCRMHGGASTGPKTEEGKARSRMAGYKHGGRSAEAIRLRREAAEARRETQAILKIMRELF
jgi:hypothetical protein